MATLSEREPIREEDDIPLTRTSWEYNCAFISSGWIPVGLDARSVHRTTASLFQSNRAQTLPVFLFLPSSFPSGLRTDSVVHLATNDTVPGIDSFKSTGTITGRQIATTI
ncbi:hypothetical protein ACCO45_007593 [Purpureocillium lilacinum]|uniref:Uncharacterized protein n=1 Tax=Purpureocillium lilacinum TaxID=33203 RepID=A0ACC4DKX4_PURLI